MKHIGLLSDTHSFLHPGLFKFFKNCDEIWHAGDFGNIDIADELSNFKPVRAVFGNMDGNDVRIVYPREHIFFCENVKVFMTHIGGYPRKYDKKAKEIIIKEEPALFICGHSHILKVMHDKKYNLLHINPGAAGKFGIHNVITAVRFRIDGTNISDLEVLELKK